jgi:soluble lytic murein transglycosylase-like protein
VSDTGTLLLTNMQGPDAQTLIVAAAPALTPVSANAGGARAPPPNELASKVFLPFIQEASIAYRLPAELIHAVIAVESNYNPRALSSKGAQGLMQLMPATARRFGAGDAFDPRQNILTGSRYLRWLMDRFNQNMELAVAAYSAGEGAVVKAGYRIPPYAETMKYVPNVLARFQRAVGTS